ncbi:cytochrome c [Virgibacillus sp. 179-BFC.A HS]|uniref:Cytochrome c n=1 Tax=Tigheibacillus jepli TaxID=3035914 RepID=A0ABU5CHV2_9BACI|nr:cytochrome c [Virgibacillus sp. 179-BFC.A HS]MDY0405100.1 cytochrome c [Virgibacillus sp. 179-BFC.A HS]
MKKALMAVLFGSALVLGACGGGGDNGNDNNGANNNDNGKTENASAAEDIFQNNCSTCHGSDLSGGAGPDLRKIGKKHDAKEIEDIIHNGKGGMPAQTQVSDEDAKTVAEWLASKK